MVTCSGDEAVDDLGPQTNSSCLSNLYRFVADPLL